MKKAVIIISILLVLTVGGVFLVNHFWPGAIEDGINGILGKGESHSLTVSVNDEKMGTATASAKAGVEGDAITLEAKPNFGYVFVGWYSGSMLVGTEEKITYIMPNEDTTVTAHFTEDVFTIQMKSMNAAYTDKNSGDYKYLSTVTLVANEIKGYTFAGWYAEGVLISNQNNFAYVVKGDAVIYAEYYSETVKILSYPIAAPADYNTPLSQIALIGGQAEVLGSFAWRNPDQIMMPGYEYMVVFDPVQELLNPVHFMLTVPLKTEVLPAPSISISGGVLSWTSVDKAKGYSININDTVISVNSATNTYTLPTDIGEYLVSVKADGDEAQVKDSLYSKVIRYVTNAPTKTEIDFADKKPIYENGELVKYAGSFVLDPGAEGAASESSGKMIFIDKDYIKFYVKIDIAQYLSKNTKLEVLKINNKNINGDTKIEIECEVILHNPVFYAEIDTAFPLAMEDVAFGLEFETATATAVNILLDGEFVDPQLRRSTLNLLFLELTGLDEPIYKWDLIQIPIPGTFGLLAVELSVAFDAVGAIAAAANFATTEDADYFVGIQLVEDGKPVFQGQFERTVNESHREFTIEGETDVEINFLRTSASLVIKNSKEEISVTRLNLDLFNLESDLSGKVSVKKDHTDDQAEFSADVAGAYRFFGQVTFEYHLEIKLNFSFLPLDGFAIKVMDGSLILADWEYFKGGTPKQAFRDEAIHFATPVSAADGEFFYYKDLDGILRKTKLNSLYSVSSPLSDIGDAEIVDIDNYYIYVQSGKNLRRVGLTAGTERTVIPGISRVVGSDRTHIFYTEEGSENVIKSYLRIDFEGKARTYLTLPNGWKAITMRYDYSLGSDVIYAEKESGEAAYFVYDGVGYTRYSADLHAYWYKISYTDDIVAYYTKDDDGDIRDAFICYPDGGITQDDNVYSIGVTPLGIFVTKDNPDKNAKNPYVMGLYTIVDGHGKYYKLCDVADKYTANRVTHEDGMSYFIDVADEKLSIVKTDGKAAYPVVSPMIDVTTKDLDTLASAILKDKLFFYEHSVGYSKVLYTIDVKTLIESPYLEGKQNNVFDKGAPEDITYTMGSDHNMTAIYLSVLSDTEIEAVSKEISDIRAQYDLIRKLLKDETDYFAKIEDAAEKMNKVFEEHPGIFSCLIDSKSASVTIPADRLSEFSYGTHAGYVITDAGYIPISIRIVDSRSPELVTTETPVFDKNSPTQISFDVKLYDDTLSIKGLTKGKHFELTNKGDGITTVTFYPSYLITLPYGTANITHDINEDEKLIFPVTVMDSRTPQDDVFNKTFDKSYPQNVVFYFDLYDEGYVTAVSGHGIGQHDYTVDQKKIVISESFLLNLDPGVWEFSMTTLEGDVPLKVTVIETLAPEVSCDREYLFGSGTDFTVKYVMNDAKYFNIRINGILLKEWEYAYDFSTSTITVFDDFVEYFVPYGNVNITVDSYVLSGDTYHLETDSLTIRVSDTRTPVANTDFISYHMQANASDIAIRAELYDNPILGLTVDGVNIPYYLTQFRDNMTVDYRGGYIVITADTIAKKLSVGVHTIVLTIGTETFEIGLNISDQRLPEPLDTQVKFNIDFPMSAQFAIALYNREFVSLGGNGIGIGDYLLRPYAGDANVKVISISAAFLQSLAPKAGDTLEFTVTTDANEFVIKVLCYEKPKVVIPPETEYAPSYVPEETPVSASTPSVTPDKAYSDYANPADLAFTVSYGENNAFGAITRGYSTLVEGRHYELTDTGFILKAEYLADFGYGDHSFTLHGYLGKSDTFTVSVYDSRSPYLEEDVVIRYDRFTGGSKQFDAILYDSAVKSITCDGIRRGSGFSSGAKTITIFDSLLSTLSIGEHVLTIGFDDCDDTITVTVVVNDTGLYFESVTKVDKSLFADDITEVFVPWTLYEGRIESVLCDDLSIGFFTRDGMMLSGFKSISYGTYTVRISANGHSFTKYVEVYDSRKPYLDKTEFTFDKAAYEYSLDPSVTAKYDLQVHVNLYDESLDGADVMLNQTITGGDITYEDYERTVDTYYISYLYLYRLPVGEYHYSIRTTDGSLPFTITVTDSHEPKLNQESPIAYDYLSDADLPISLELFGEPLSSLSYVTFLGSDLAVIPAEFFTLTANDEDFDTLTIHKDFFKRSDIYSDYDYRFRITTTTERTLDFFIRIENGPKRPCTVTFVYEPFHVHPDGTIEPDISIPPQNLYYGDYIVRPEDPTHEYYNFLGFFTEKNGGTLVDFSQPVTSDMSIFPRFEPKTYKINLISDSATINTLSVKYLDKIPAFSTPAKTGYNFIRWTADAENAIRFTVDTMPHEDVNVYAQWEIATYKVIFKDAGGAILKTETVTAFEDATPPTDEEMYIDEYHTFKGWDGAYTNILSNRTLTAVYDIVKFNITYVLDGGTNPSDAPTQYTIDGGVKLKTPTKRGYAFLGWYSEPEFVNIMTVIPANRPDGITLYAKWEVGTYGVILENAVNGVEYPYSTPINNDRMSITYDTSYKLPILSLGSGGYAFLGWYSGQNGTGTQYTDANGNSLRNWSDVSIVNLYPHVIDLLTLTNVNVSAGTLSFNINQNLSTGVTIKSIDLLKYRTKVDSIESITGTGTYTFTGIDDEVEYEVIVTFEYELENTSGTTTTTRSFKVKSASNVAAEIVTGQTIAEILVKRDAFASYSITGVTVLDALGETYNAYVYYPASAASSALNTEDGWVYLTGLIANAYYTVYIDYTYTLSDYAGTYQAKMHCGIRTDSTLFSVPTPTLNVTSERAGAGSDSSYYYYTYNIRLTPSDVYLENEVRILRYEILASDGSIVSAADYNSYLGGSNNAFTISISRSLLTDGAVFSYRVYYTYNNQRGNGYVEAFAESDQFIADLADTNNSSSDGGGCIIDETPVLMADGTYKRAEDVKIGDMLLVWSFETGSLRVSPVTAIHTATFDEIVYLKFSDGTVIGIADLHAFYSLDHEKYVNIGAVNVHEFLGTHFAALVDGEMSTVMLVDYEIVTETRTAYTIATAGGFNHFAENLLCALPFVHVLNLFEFDGLQYNMEALQKDIEKYGLLPYEAAADLITYEQFLALNGPYFSVAIGKGLMTIDELRAIIIDYYDEITM